MLEIIKNRGVLNKTITAIKNGKLTIGFIGGSITDGRTRSNWPEPVSAWFINRFENLRVVIENAAIGATGSDAAIFRAKRDLIDKNCDIVFVEFAVNDLSTPTERRMRTREGLLRMLIANKIDVVLVYTFSQAMYKSMIADEMPDSISEFEILAEHYNLSSVWMGLNAFNEVKQGYMRFEEWLPDGLHPQSRGSYSYAQSVIDYLENALIEDISIKNTSLPLPLNTLNWENTEFVHFDEINTQGAWLIKRWNKYSWIDQVLETASVGSKLSFSFVGRGLTLIQDFGNTSAEYRYSLDGGEWKTTNRPRYSWCGDEGWFYTDVISDELENTTHFFELEVVHGDREECKGTNFRLAYVGIVK